MENNSVIIAVDGFSSCGKSTVAKQLASAYHFIYVDTGAMYRSVALYILRNDIDMDDPMQLAAALDNISIEFNRDGVDQIVHLNGEPVEHLIRTAEINNIVSDVARISSIRKKLVAMQRDIASGKSVVMDGRDIGTVVFPDADLKFFLTADIEIRTKRRYDEMLENGFKPTMEEISENLKKRDLIDSTRDDSPLKQAEDAILINNSYLSREDQLIKLKEIVDNYLLNIN